jgi:RNA polymerase primary sigma factor
MLLTSGDGWSEAQSEGEEGSAGGEEESQSRQEPEDQVAQGAAAKKLLRAKAPARAQKAPPAKAAAHAKGGAPQPADKHGKGAARLPSRAPSRRSSCSKRKVAEVKGKGKGVRGGARAARTSGCRPGADQEDAETRRTRLKNLIKLGKERGFLTYSEINDHLPDDLVDAEQIEAIISTFGDMGIQVYDQAPDQETAAHRLRRAAGRQPDDDVEEQAEAALSTVDSEFGRTTDPVRMYMREMGSVELLTREARSRSPSASRTACAT